MSTCIACQAPILWAVTAATGKPMPLDAAPNPDGNVVLTGETRATSHGVAPVAVVLGRTLGLFDEENDVVYEDDARYMPHHATCPDADRFRRQEAKRVR